MGEEKIGSFVGFVLLSSPDLDLERLKRDLYEDWAITVPDIDGDEERAAWEHGNLVFETDGMLAVISLMPTPVPAGEAEYYAEGNYYWKGAVDAAREHQAHIMTAVMPKETPDPIEAGKLFVKLNASCLKQDNAMAVYTSGTVFQPEMYCQVALDMHTTEHTLPILDWIYIGMYKTDEGMNGYTYGMAAFGKDEVEVIGSKAQPSELHEFIFRITSYILYEDVLLGDGMTIGFSEDEKLPVTKSQGVSVEGESLKISFQPGF